MTTEISATFEIKGWDEQPFDEAVGVAKLTKASVAKQYADDVERPQRSCGLRPPASRGEPIIGLEGTVSRRARLGGLLSDYSRASLAS